MVVVGNLIDDEDLVEVTLLVVDVLRGVVLVVVFVQVDVVVVVGNLIDEDLVEVPRLVVDVLCSMVLVVVFVQVDVLLDVLGLEVVLIFEVVVFLLVVVADLVDFADVSVLVLVTVAFEVFGGGVLVTVFVLALLVLLRRFDVLVVVFGGCVLVPVSVLVLLVVILVLVIVVVVVVLSVDGGMGPTKPPLISIVMFVQVGSAEPSPTEQTASTESSNSTGEKESPRAISTLIASKRTPSSASSSKSSLLIFKADEPQMDVVNRPDMEESFRIDSNPWD